ncbi:hypothetical protein VCRA2119O147_1120008 [Vibrio crassostreae]|nr:hypothetical protein VCRA2118O236_420028 [Vibrio crassostreae]CAK2259082.1 hypothetical protein VCRA2119O147_1120008 [Vibrio crassostreae]CAK2604922.1 hypothetical protein VCRA2121O264_130007 [Vibrio crassostreae]CAK2927848.1 hypothetical protein VCRA2110O183_470011 [Vibrio crassostreae]CAK2963269.1 hypothetical protein VCRA2113O229_400028 [Vibrio crassostreae]
MYGIKFQYYLLIIKLLTPTSSEVNILSIQYKSDPQHNLSKELAMML